MPTATAFTWDFPWAEMVGGFNSLIIMLSIPVALAIAVLLAFAVAGYVPSLVKRGVGALRGH